MLYKLFKSIYRGGSRFIDQAEFLTPAQWGIVAIVLLVIGAFCMRGFGSRANL